MQFTYKTTKDQYFEMIDIELEAMFDDESDSEDELQNQGVR